MHKQMRLAFLKDSLDDYVYWSHTDKAIFKKINRLINDCEREPFGGIGKPEPLKFEMSGCWSRRITNEHRLVYKIEDDTLVIMQCRNHY
jgi:toxin YoeB